MFELYVKLYMCVYTHMYMGENKAEDDESYLWVYTGFFLFSFYLSAFSKYSIVNIHNLYIHKNILQPENYVCILIAPFYFD